MKDLAKHLGALSLAAVVSACANAPHRTAATDPNCSAMAARIAAAEQDEQAAIEAGQKAWKTLIPATVALQYAKSQADASIARSKRNSLQAQSDALGCLRSSA